MKSPTTALLWDIWARHRRLVCVVVALTGVSWIVDVTRLVPPDGDGSAPPLQQLMGMCSFLLLFGVFNSTESSGEIGLGRLPPRLFTLPVSSLRLLAVPVLAGTTSIVLLYLLWRARLSQGGSTSDLFVVLLLASLMVFYQAGLCIFVRLGPLRLIALGTIAFAIFVIGLLPAFPPSPPSLWRSETALSGMVASLALVVFLAAWRQVANLRSGGGRGGLGLASMVAAIADAMPRRRQAFASAVSAQFWFEWRCSGMALPLLVAGLLLVVIAPASWVAQGDPDGTLRLMLWTLAMPIVVAIPVGMAFSRPRIWSDDLTVPAFVAVRPLSAEELVATKVKVALISAAISWLVVLAFLGVWLSSWANLDGVNRAAGRLQALYDSRYAVYGIAALIVCGGLILTWRFLVSRLWSSLAGSRRLFIASGASIALPAIAVAVTDIGAAVRWISADARVTTLIWLAAIVVVARYSLAACSWRTITPHHTRQYLLVWLASTSCLVTLAWLLLDIVRLSVPFDVYRFRSLAILLALVAVPLWRVDLAPSSLARNRHR